MELIGNLYSNLVGRKNEENTGVSVAVGLHSVKCQVCQSSIEVLVDDSLPRTVKCNSCNEDTPIKEAPFGYNYVRCECNCLLLAEDRPTEVRCTKPECKKIIRESQVCCTCCAYPFHLYPDDNHCSVLYCTQFSKFLNWFACTIYSIAFIPLSIFVAMVFFPIDSVAQDNRAVVGYGFGILVIVVMFTIGLHSTPFLIRISQMDGPITIMGLAKELNDKLNSFYYNLIRYRSKYTIGFPN